MRGLYSRERFRMAKMVKIVENGQKSVITDNLSCDWSFPGKVKNFPRYQRYLVLVLKTPWQKLTFKKLTLFEKTIAVEKFPLLKNFKSIIIYLINPNSVYMDHFMDRKMSPADLYPVIRQKFKLFDKFNQ